jgi:hypothetical protein
MKSIQMTLACTIKERLNIRMPTMRSKEAVRARKFIIFIVAFIA